MENNPAGKLHNDLARWLRATLCGQPPPQERAALEQKIKRFKQRQDAMSLAFIYLRKSRDEYVQWFSASIVEVCCTVYSDRANLLLYFFIIRLLCAEHFPVFVQEIVNKRWHTLSLEVREKFRNGIYALLLQQAKVPNLHFVLYCTAVPISANVLVAQAVYRIYILCLFCQLLCAVTMCV